MKCRHYLIVFKSTHRFTAEKEYIDLLWKIYQFRKVLVQGAKHFAVQDWHAHTQDKDDCGYHWLCKFLESRTHTRGL